MGMSFKQMYTQIGQFAQDTSSGRQTRIKDSINRQYRKLAEGEDWSDLWRIDTAEVTVHAGVPYVYLPAHVDVLKMSVLDSINDLLTVQDPAMFMSRYYSNLGSSSNPYALTPLGSSAIKREIASAETLIFVSSDASDTTPVVEVWGLVSGEEVNEQVTLNGTTNVTTSNSFSRITRIGTSSSRADSSRSGNITVTGTTSSLEYAVIKSHEFESRYQQLRAQDAPNANDTLSIFYKKKVQPLINDGDTLELDGDLAVIEFTIADILQQQGKYNQANVHNQEGERLRLKMMSRYAMQTNVVMQSIPNGPGTRQSDQYGLYNRRISVNNG